jgi:hypothetical protein
MNLYNKKLRNLEELEKEKRRLLREKKRLDKEPIITLDDVVSGISEGGAPAVGGILANILPSVLPLVSSFSGPLVGTIVGILQKRFTRSKDRSDTGTDDAPQTKKKGSGVLSSVAKEVIGSYLMGKALQLSYKGISLVIMNKKKKKADKKAAAYTEDYHNGEYTH